MRMLLLLGSPVRSSLSIAGFDMPLPGPGPRTAPRHPHRQPKLTMSLAATFKNVASRHCSDERARFSRNRNAPTPA
jgi:hypothetical protein